MPSKLTQMLVERGVVSKHAAQLLERWKSLPDGVAEAAGSQQIETEEALAAFAEEIDGLLQVQERGKAEVALD